MTNTFHIVMLNEYARKIFRENSIPGFFLLGRCWFLCRKMDQDGPLLMLRVVGRQETKVKREEIELDIPCDFVQYIVGTIEEKYLGFALPRKK